MAKGELVQRILAEASELGPEARAIYLDAECGGDATLRDEVESLLRSHDEAGRFLASPTSDMPPVRVGGFASGSAAVVHEGPGTRIGPYRLLQLIGEGGFGSVFLAEQEEPVRRRVALKIIKLGMDTRTVIARFEAERQALALMDHPNIAKVLDAGSTETGRPYFVMELVRGEPITEYCDRNTVGIEDRLDLFQQTCHAVQHAHQKGIIHRDIKPSNVLVTLQDGRPVPKVIDFGIAKAMSHRLTEKTVFTELRQFIGTPEYMSPEQAEMSGIDIDTRTDVYSLGVVLYELLTGTTPFDPRKLRSAAYGEIQRIIREDTPAKPSTRLSTLDTLPAVAAHRLCEPNRLGVLVRGDLDWIVMKAMEKDRTRRYESASAFAADVRRFLDHEPTVASPPSATYRVRKFVRRHRGGVMAGAVIAAALVAGVVGTTWGMVRALDEKSRADAAAASERVAKEESRARADALEKVAAFQSAQLAGVDLRQMGIGLRGDLLAGIRAGGDRTGEAAGAIVERVDAVDGALAHVDLTGVARSAMENSILRPAIGAIREQFADQPLVRAELLLNVSEAARYAGSLEFAVAPGEEALKIRMAELGAADAKTMEARRCRAMLMKDRGQLEEAEAEMRACLIEARGVHGDDARVTVDAKANLATVLTARSEYAEAAELYLSSLPWYREHLGPLDRQTLGCMASAASALSNLERFDEAERLFLESVGGFRSAYGLNDQRTIQAMNNFAVFYRRREEYSRASEVYDEALAAGRAALGEDHWLTLMIVDNIGGVRFAQDDAEGAARFARAALEGRHRTLGESHPATLRSCFNLASVEKSRGNNEEAAGLFRRAVEGFRGAYGEFHAHTIAARSSLAALLMTMGRFEECVGVLIEEHGLLDRHPEAPTDRRGALAESLAEAYEAWEGAEPGNGHGTEAAAWRLRAGEGGGAAGSGGDGPG